MPRRSDKSRTPLPRLSARCNLFASKSPSCAWYTHRVPTLLRVPDVREETRVYALPLYQYASRIKTMTHTDESPATATWHSTLFRRNLRGARAAIRTKRAARQYRVDTSIARDGQTDGDDRVQWVYPDGMFRERQYSARCSLPLALTDAKSVTSSLTSLSRHR